MVWRHAHLLERVAAAATEAPGSLDADVRRVIQARAAALGGDPDLSGTEVGTELGTELTGPMAAYVDKVALEAYRVVDGDVEAILAEGYGEDDIFEMTVCASVGAALGRFERGIRALADTER